MVRAWLAKRTKLTLFCSSGSLRIGIATSTPAMFVLFLAFHGHAGVCGSY